MKLSIIIASYNRAENLHSFLREIGCQVLPDGVEWEVLVVDNNSTDETKNRIAPFVQENSKKYRYLFEGRQGKSYALNTGIREATGDILVFTDDDCFGDPCWLAAIAREFASDSSLAVLGGRVELFEKQDQPVSIRTCRERTLVSSFDQLSLLMIGCNMAMRRNIAQATREFDPFLGPGTKTEAMEDLDVLYRVFKKKYKIVYSPDVLIYHNHGRVTDEQIQTLNYKYVVGRGAFYCKHMLRGDLYVLKLAYWETRSLMKALFKGMFAHVKIDDEKRFLRALFVGASYRLVWNELLRQS